MTYYDKSRKEALAQLLSDEHSGLRPSEVLARQEKYGPNKLREKKKKTLFQRFLGQFKDVLILILIAAAAGAAESVCFSHIFIMAVPLLNVK